MISTSVSVSVKKIPTDEKDCRKCSFTCLLCTATAVAKSGPKYS